MIQIRRLVRPQSTIKLITFPQQQQSLIHSSTKNQSLVLTSFAIAGAAIGSGILLENLSKKKAQVQQQTNNNEEQVSKRSVADWVLSTFFPAKGFYPGGFDEQMTKREAALILGIRESASRERIREAHRHLSRANHPDTGGSPYLAVKINEAKDLLLNSK